jgi:hypothetical protein
MNKYWKEEEFCELQNLMRNNPDSPRFIELREKYIFLDNNLVKAIGYGCCSAVVKVNNRGCTFESNVECTEEGEWRIKVLPVLEENARQIILDFVKKYFPRLDCRVEEKKKFLFVYLRNKYREDYIEGFNKWILSKGELDLDIVIYIGKAVCTAINVATDESCLCSTEVGETMGEYGPQWVLKFIHGHLKNKDQKFKKGAGPEYYLRDGLIAGGAEIPLIVAKFMDTMLETVNSTVEEDEEDGIKFTMYINKKLFPVVKVEVGKRIQKVRLVDPDYCGIDLETQEYHAQFMLTDIDRLQKHMFDSYKKQK